MKLSSRELKDFFVGNLLGDGYLHNNSFNVRQISKDLIEFKSEIIRKNLPNAKIKIKKYDASNRNGVNRKEFWNLYVSPMVYFKKLQEEFYPNGKKIIPKKYLRELSPLGYAIWYADDGTTILVGKNKNTGSARARRVQLCTDNFPTEDTKKISKIIDKQYGNTRIVERKPHQHRIQINGKNAQHFIVDISKYFETYFPSLLYKMDLGYRGTSLLNKRYVTDDYFNLYIKISAQDEFIDRMINR